MRPGHHTDRRTVLSALAGWAAAGFAPGPPALAQGLRQPAKPRLAPGRHPGGPPAAVIGAGVDYTRDVIASRLARDGEGEAIALDTVDGDNRPWERPPDRAGTDAALALLDAAPGASLIPVRVPPGDERALVAALAFVARTPARLALVAMGGESRDRPFAEAARHAPHLLLVAPAGFGAARRDDPMQAPAPPVTAIVVTACDGAGDVPAAVGHGQRVDVAVPVADPAGVPAGADGGLLELYAAARVAALALRIVAVAPQLNGPALRERVLSFAAPLPGGITRHGWIPDVMRVHRPE